MLASPDGEADNAGRAVGQLAKRLGLSGGDLKEMFLAGAGQPAGKAADRADIAVLKREIAELESALRSAVIERDAARGELTTMRLGTYRQKAEKRGQLALLLALVPIAVLAVIAVAMYGPDLSITRSVPDVRAGAAATPGSAVVRSRATLLYRDPDRMSPVVSALNAGTGLVVKRLVWNLMSQWAEVETGTQKGYVAVTDVELR